MLLHWQQFVHPAGDAFPLLRVNELGHWPTAVCTGFGVTADLDDDPFCAIEPAFGKAPFGLAQFLLKLGCFGNLSLCEQVIDLNKDLLVSAPISMATWAELGYPRKHIGDARNAARPAD